MEVREIATTYWSEVPYLQLNIEVMWNLRQQIFINPIRIRCLLRAADTVSVYNFGTVITGRANTSTRTKE